MQRILSTIFLIILSIHSFYDLEHQFYVNEIFALCGFFIYFRYKYYLQIKFDINNPVSALNWFLIVLLFRISLSLIVNPDFNSYVFLRTISIFYSVFIFFLGIFVVNKIKNIKIFCYPYLIATAVIGSFHGLYITLILYQKKVTKIFKIVIILSGLGMVIRAGGNSLTTICILSAWILYFFYEANQKKLLNIKYIGYILFSSVGFALIFIYIYYKNTFSDFTYYGYSVFGDNIDTNIYWRLMYWYYSIEQTIEHHFLLGIGFGTKIYDLSDPMVSGWLPHGKDVNPYIEYVHGPHNSLIFIFVRTGIIGLIVFLSVLTSFLNYFFKYQKINIKYICVFIAVNIVMFFNVTLESPRFSIYYWMCMGLSYGYLNKSLCVMNKNKLE
jgi:hypothetical protein